MAIRTSPPATLPAAARDPGDLLPLVRAGLSERPRTLPPVLFYDRAGSELFDAITETPEYYVTKSEQEILDHHARKIVDHMGARPLEVVELGAGSATKTETLLAALLDKQGPTRFLPIDVSVAALDGAAARLTSRYPDLTVEPVVARNRAGLSSIPRTRGTNRLVLFLGSSIGNYEPEEAAEFLSDVAATLAPDDRLLLGVDLRKDEAVLHAAYNDAAGVTARFNLNVLVRLNRELGADFDLASFEHHAHFNPGRSRIEMHLRSTRDQVVHIPGMEPVAIARGETIHTENSYKYTDKALVDLAHAAGLEPDARWRDSRGWFSLQLLRRGPA